MTVAAWVLPIAFSGVWTLAALAWSTAFFIAGLLLANAFVRPRSFERSARAYRCLGVRRFKTVVVFGDVMNRTLRRLGWSAPFPLSLERMARWLTWTRWAERIHWAWLLASLPFIYTASRAGRPALAAWVLCGNVPFNIYPILLQRYTRVRLERILTAETQRSQRTKQL
jgi:hypothetical protein